jgi:hypothetical protein
VNDQQEQQNINIQIGGNNSGQLAFGKNITQIQGAGRSPEAARETAGGDATELRLRLRAVLDAVFSENDLRDLCFDMDIDYDNLPGSGKSARARELILYCENRGRLNELTDHVRRLRPQALT